MANFILRKKLHRCVLCGFLSVILSLLAICCKENEKQSGTSSTHEAEGAPVDLPLDSLKGIIYGCVPQIDREDEQLVSLYKATRPVYDILYKIIKSSKLVNTPPNNLNWYRIIDGLISSSGLPYDSVMNTINEIIDWYDGGKQSDINHAAYIRQVMSHYHQLEQFNRYIQLCPDRYKEYEVWSTLQAGMIDQYIHDMYERNHYSSLPMDVSAGIVNHLDSVTAILKKQNDMLAGVSLDLSISPSNTWNSGDENTAGLLLEWQRQRKSLSERLPSNIQTEYDKITLSLESFLGK